MLIDTSIDTLSNAIDDRYLLATVVAKRARNLSLNKASEELRSFIEAKEEMRVIPPLTEEVCENMVSQATKELADGLISWKEDAHVRIKVKEGELEKVKKFKVWHKGSDIYISEHGKTHHFVFSGGSLCSVLDNGTRIALDEEKAKIFLKAIDEANRIFSFDEGIDKK